MIEDREIQLIPRFAYDGDQAWSQDSQHKSRSAYDGDQAWSQDPQHKSRSAYEGDQCLIPKFTTQK